MKEYITNTKRRIVLSSVLGKGGEGTVFHIQNDEGLVAKIYTDGKQLERRDKISVMIAKELNRHSHLVAFPIEMLLDRRGEFVGFTMRKVGGAKPIHELYAPGSRKIEFAKADFRFLARAATNLARAIASIHKDGCVIGDINHSGILVSDQATVTIIDADSFQVRAGSMVYRCRVGVGEYTPPELQGKPLAQVDREPAHDAFGLAVIVFQLLFMGRHPFAGRYGGHGDMPIEQAIKEGRFAYSVQRRAEVRMDPPPYVPTLSDVTPELAAAFERAFPSSQGLYRGRPPAADWVHILSRFESELIPCRINSAHHHPKNSPSCPWCHLENGMGVSLFLSSGGSTQTATVRSNFDLEAALTAIEAIRGPGPASNPAAVISVQGLVKSPVAREARRNFLLRRLAALALGALSFGLMLNGYMAAFLGLLVAGLLTFGGGEARRRLEAAKRHAESGWSDVLREWELESGPARFNQKKAELRTLAIEYRGLSALEKSRLDDLDRRRRDAQMQKFLEGHLIARAKIPGIGPGRKATLASYGIEDAFNVTSGKVRNVPGFGDAMTKKLLTWRSAIERKFVFNPALGTDPAAIRQVKDGISRRRSEIEHAFGRAPTELEQLRTYAITARSRPTQRLIEAYRALKQAECDLA